MNILERVKLGCMDIDTQFKEADTVEEFDSNDGYKCTKKNISEKGSFTFKKKYWRLKDQEREESMSWQEED